MIEENRGGPSEFLAGLALRNRKKILDRNLKIITENLPLLDSFFDSYSNLFSWHKPNAGPFALVKMRFDTDDMAFAQKALKEQGILLLPGGVYDFGGFFRIGFGRRKMPEALKQFESFVSKNLIDE